MLPSIRIAVYTTALLLAVATTSVLRYDRGGKHSSVAASIVDPTAKAHLVNAISGQSGVVPYFMPIARSTSTSATAQAISNWSNYLQGRAQWGMPANSISRLANADFVARQNGNPTITPAQAAAAATYAINAKLATMSTSQLQTLYQQMMIISGPNGSYSAMGFNPNYFAISANNGSYTVAVNAIAFSDQKQLYASLAPQMMSNSTNLYPSEIQIIFYSLASGDLGMDSTRFAAYAQQLSSITGIDMNTMTPFGQNGYLARRPLNTFIDQQFLDTFYTQLGF